MAESLIPIIRNIRVRKVQGGSFGTPSRTPCPAPDTGANLNQWVSFDLLCWNPNRSDVHLAPEFATIDDLDPYFAFAKGFYRYRFLPITGNYSLNRLVDAPLQDIEGSIEISNSIHYYQTYQGISAGWKARNDGERLCEMVPFPPAHERVEGILEITADTQNYFQALPKGDAKTWIVLKFSLGTLQHLSLDDLTGIESNPKDRHNLVQILGLHRVQFSAPALALVESGTTQTIKHGNEVIVGFNRAVVAARRALDAIKANNFTHVLRLGNPDAYGRHPFHAFSGPTLDTRIRGERCDLISAPSVGNIEGRWKLMDGSKELFDFGFGESNARLACALVRNRTYQYYCSTGNPDASLRYLK